MFTVRQNLNEFTPTFYEYTPDAGESISHAARPPNSE